MLCLSADCIKTMTLVTAWHRKANTQSYASFLRLVSADLKPNELKEMIESLELDV
jgi:hypothetical protein